MKLVIFGATGKIGRHLVDQALEQGHDVTAFARNPAKLGPPREHLHVAKGDVLDPTSLSGPINSGDAVLCALGMPLMNKAGLRARGTRNIIHAMQQTGGKRLVCLTVLGAGDSWNLLPFHYKYFLVPLLMRHVYADHERQESYVKDSQLDWVIVRPASFTNGERTGTYRHGFTAADTPLALKISQADVAGFMLKQVTDDTYLHQTPGLSY